MTLTDESILVEIGGYSATTVRFRDLKPEIKQQILQNQRIVDDIMMLMSSEKLLPHSYVYQELNKIMNHTQHPMETVEN